MKNDAADSRRDAALKRWGAAIPGTVTWVIIVLSVVGIFAFPGQWLVCVLLFLAFLVGRLAVHLLMAVIAEVRVKRWKARDWTLDETEVSPVSGLAPADVRHVVLIPNYKEPLDVLRRTLDGLAVQHAARERIIPVLGMEEREQGARVKAERLAAEYRGRFADVVVSVHPADLPGEIGGKSSNQAWAGRVAREAINRLGIDIDRVTISSCDSDSVFHPKYFSAVASLFVNDDRRYNRFWQAPLHFYGNIRTVPFIMRLDFVFMHTSQLAELTLPGFSPLPISTYTASMRLIEDSDWWDAGIIPEDWHMYLRSYFAKDGDVSTKAVFLPTWGDIVDGENTIDAVKARYTQIIRHDWGAEDVGYMVAEIPKSKAPWGKTAFLFFHVLHDHVLRAVVWAVLTSGTVIGWQVSHNIDVMWFWWYFSPWMTALYIINTALFVCTLVIEGMRRSAAGAPLLVLLSEMFATWVMIPFMGIFSGTIPALIAQTKLMLGLPIEYKVAPKRLVERVPES